MRTARLETQRNDAGYSARIDSGIKGNAADLGVRISSLEKSAAIGYNLRTSVTGNAGCINCPVKGCYKTYTTVHKLHYHLGTQHSYLKPLTEQVKCLQCDLSFDTPQGLAQHEKISHELIYRTRIENYSKFFRQDLCKFDLNCLFNISILTCRSEARLSQTRRGRR